MNIRKITEEVLELFPELKESGFSPVDINFAYSFYIDEIISLMINNTDKIGLSFGDIGIFYTNDKKVGKRAIKSMQYHLTKNDEEFEKMNNKTLKIVNLLKTKIKYHQDGIDYMSTYNDLPRTKVYLAVKGGSIKYIETILKKINDSYDKRIIARNMAKQKADNGGSKESDIQEGAHRTTCKGEIGNMQ